MTCGNFGFFSLLLHTVNSSIDRVYIGMNPTNYRIKNKSETYLNLTGEINPLGSPALM